MAGKARSFDLRHLVRLDGPGTAGWQLRLPNWHPQNGRTVYYSDAHFGGSDAAYAHALSERDRMFAEVGLPLRQVGNNVHSRSKSGTIGVRLAKYPNRPGAGAFSWIATWPESTGQKKRAFSVLQRGFDEALLAALRLRESKTNRPFTAEQIKQAMQLRDLVAEHVLLTGTASPRAAEPPAKKRSRSKADDSLKKREQSSGS